MVKLRKSDILQKSNAKSLGMKIVNILFLAITVIICCFALQNYYISVPSLNYICYSLYLVMLVMNSVFGLKKINPLLLYIGGAVMILALFIVRDYFIIACVAVFLYLQLKKIKKVRWLYIVFTFIAIVLICLPLFAELVFRPKQIETNFICDESPSGNRILSRNVYDNGLAGYMLTYFITEKHGIFERKYAVAGRGVMDDAKNQKFLDENTLEIQGILYDISGRNVVFRLGGTGHVIHRPKRKTIALFI